VVKLPQPERIASRLPDPARAQTETTTEENSAPKTSNAPRETDIPLYNATKESSPDRKESSPDGKASKDTVSSTPQPKQAAANDTMQHSGPMDAVLHMPPPASSQHPHISKPAYVHHFDSYTLVKQLEGGGYTQGQAITVMKAVRGLLAQNLDVAQEGLVGKSDVDNVGYSNAPCLRRDDRSFISLTLYL
jgi:hypothetical protein